jgi:predicted amino acid racemase
VLTASFRPPTPRLEIFPRRIAENTRAVLTLCREHGVVVSCITKVVCAHPAAVRGFRDGGATMLGDSRVENLRAIRQSGFRGPLLLTRLPTPSRAAEVVDVADTTLVSSEVTIRALGAAARAAGRVHQGILMVDVGDLREGVWEDRVLPVARTAQGVEGFELVGLGCNLACFGGVIPTAENTGRLVALRDRCRAELGLDLKVLSGGNSSGLPLLASGRLPPGVNHYRVGEAILLGRNVIDRSPWPGTRQDTFVVVGEVLELELKPSVPVGERGQDAFGHTEPFPERGTRRRAILDLGRQDVVVTGLEPVEPGVQVLGGSSDHLVVDVEDCRRSLQVGAQMGFYPSYGALLALATSPYVTKQVVDED